MCFTKNHLRGEGLTPVLFIVRRNNDRQFNGRTVRKTGKLDPLTVFVDEVRLVVVSVYLRVRRTVREQHPAGQQQQQHLKHKKNNKCV